MRPGVVDGTAAGGFRKSASVSLIRLGQKQFFRLWILVQGSEDLTERSSSKWMHYQGKSR